jgi:hypothetical protein
MYVRTSYMSLFCPNVQNEATAGNIENAHQKRIVHISLTAK